MESLLSKILMWELFPLPFVVKIVNVVRSYASLNQVYVGKEKQTVAEMLPYLRLGYISDPDEMQSILSSEGDTCPVSLPTLPWCCYLFLHWFGWVLLKYDAHMHKSTCPDNYLTYFSFLELRLVPVWLFFWLLYPVSWFLGINLAIQFRFNCCGGSVWLQNFFIISLLIEPKTKNMPPICPLSSHVNP